MKIESLSIFILTLIIIFCIVPKVNGEIIFEDVTNFAGIQHNGSTYGSYWGDLNGDGWADLWQGNHGSFGNGSKLFENNKNGKFFEIGQKLGIEKISVKDIQDNHGASWADYDNDGDQDVIILVGAERGLGNGSNVFLVFEKDSFEDKSADYGLDYPLGRGRAPLWFDWNQDGLLDLLMSNHPRPDQKAPTILFSQTTRGFIPVKTFEELTYVPSVQYSDISGDGKMDLIFLSGNVKRVFDLTDLQFINIIENLGLNNIWGSDWVFADFNNDQKLDIFWVKQNFKNDKLFFNDITNLGIENKFNDVTKTSGLENPTSCNGAVSGDFDNDMDMDIYSVCSFLELNPNETVNASKNIPNMLYENLGNGTFDLVFDAGGAVSSELGLGETVSMVDFDNDGFLDLYVTNGWNGEITKSTGPSQLFRNLGNENNWLEIDLVGTISNRDGIGSNLIISSGNVTQIREQNGGMHFRAQNHQRIHVGLGSNDLVDYIIVYWPSNIVSAQKNISANQIVKITEPFKSISPKSQVDLGINPLNVRCNEDLDLIFKNKSKVACVKSLTAISLINRGWYQDFNLLSNSQRK